MNVAAYCRVSTDNEDQVNSFENQYLFFNEYIKRNPEWNLVKIYSDEGVTGTNVKKRVGFNSMINDAEDGKIDLIITKEVSRFARNTVDTLHYTRELSKRNVGVYFINDNINTLDGDGEFRLSIMASVAQEESRKTSTRVKWGMRRQMERGFVFTSPVIGYDLKNGQLIINKEEAEIVRRIFHLYVNEELGTGIIARKFAAENVPLYKTFKSWSATSIMRILKNEKYVGDLIQQKTIVKDYLSHKSVPNKGEKIIFKNHHEPIVDRETWEKAQTIRNQRSVNNVNYNPRSHNNKYWCSGKVECGICHSSFVSKTKEAAYGKIRAYRCKKNHTGTNGCHNNSYVDERILKACMQFVVKQLAVNSDAICGELTKAYSFANNDNREMDNLSILEEKLNKHEQKKKKLLSLLVDEVITKEEYQEASKDIDLEIYNIKSQINDIKKEQKSVLNNNEQLITILNLAREYMKQTEPTTLIYSQILDRIISFPEQVVEVHILGINTPFKVKYSTSGKATQYVVNCELI